MERDRLKAGYGEHEADGRDKTVSSLTSISTPLSIFRRHDKPSFVVPKAFLASFILCVLETWFANKPVFLDRDYHEEHQTCVA
jgi:hypothetical protein